MPSKTESAGTMAERMPRDLDNADDFPGLKEQEKLLQQFRSHLLSSFPRPPVLPSGEEKEDFHPDRAPHRNCDHRDSGRNASSGIESGKGKSTFDCLSQ